MADFDQARDSAEDAVDSPQNRQGRCLMRESRVSVCFVVPQDSGMFSIEATFASMLCTSFLQA